MIRMAICPARSRGYVSPAGEAENVKEGHTVPITMDGAVNTASSISRSNDVPDPSGRRC